MSFIKHAGERKVSPMIVQDYIIRKIENESIFSLTYGKKKRLKYLLPARQNNMHATFRMHASWKLAGKQNKH